MGDRSRFASSSKDIRGFFRPVGKIEHEVNIEIQLTQDKLKMLKEKQNKVEQQRLLEEKIKADIARRLEEEAQREAPDKRTFDEVVRDSIEEATAGEGEIVFIPKKGWNRREIYWEDVAKYAIEHGNARAYRDYSEVFKGCHDKARAMRLKRWKDDYRSGKNTRKRRAPAYGDGEREAESQIVIFFEQVL